MSGVRLQTAQSPELKVGDKFTQITFYNSSEGDYYWGAARHTMSVEHLKVRVKFNENFIALTCAREWSEWQTRTNIHGENPVTIKGTDKTGSQFSSYRVLRDGSASLIVKRETDYAGGGNFDNEANPLQISGLADDAGFAAWLSSLNSIEHEKGAIKDSNQVAESVSGMLSAFAAAIQKQAPELRGQFSDDIGHAIKRCKGGQLLTVTVEEKKPEPQPLQKASRWSRFIPRLRS